jgi:hypothetical protein
VRGAAGEHDKNDGHVSTAMDNERLELYKTNTHQTDRSTTKPAQNCQSTPSSSSSSLFL